MGFGMAFVMGFDLFGLMFTIIFVIVFIVILVTIIKGIGQWNKNNHSPRLTVDATVVTKRIDVKRHNHANAGDTTGAHGFHTSSATFYYVTFQVASGDRMELAVNGREYGILVEGDKGMLTFQGTRYLSFERRYDLQS